MIQLLVAVTLFIVMLDLGMGLPPDDLRHWLRQPSMVLRVAFGSCLLVPLLGIGLIHSPWGHALSAPSRVAMALMALCPSAPMAMRLAHQYGGVFAFSALVQVVTAMLAMVTIPLLAPFFPHAFDRGGWLAGELTLTLQTAWDVATQVARVQVLPLLLGLLLRRNLPVFAVRIEKPLKTMGSVLLLSVVILVLGNASPFLARFVVGNLAAMLLMAIQVVGCLVIGLLLAGRDQQGHGRTAATVTAMRNGGLALLFATQFGEPMGGLNVAILLYLLVTWLICVPLLRWGHAST